MFFELIIYFNDVCFGLAFRSLKNGINKREMNINIESFINKKDFKKLIEDSIVFLNINEDKRYKSE